MKIWYWRILSIFIPLFCLFITLLFCFIALFYAVARTELLVLKKDSRGIDRTRFIIYFFNDRVRMV